MCCDRVPATFPAEDLVALFRAQLGQIVEPPLERISDPGTVRNLGEPADNQNAEICNDNCWLLWSKVALGTELLFPYCATFEIFCANVLAT